MPECDEDRLVQQTAHGSSPHTSPHIQTLERKPLARPEEHQKDPLATQTHMLFSQLPSTSCSWLQLIPLGWPGGKLYTAILCLWSLLLLL